MVRRHLTQERVVLTVAALLVVSVLALATWSAVFATTSTAERPQIDADVEQRYESIDGIEATQTTTIERNGTVESRTVYEAKLRPGTGEKRLAVRNSTAERYDLRVSNGSMLWLYDRSAGNATRIPLDNPRGESGQGARIGRLFEQLNRTTSAETPVEPRGVEPLPAVPQSGGVSAGVPDAPAATSMGVSYEGTATIDGRETYVLRVAPRNASSNSTYAQTLWIDSEHFYPLKKRTAWTANGQRTVMTTTYTNVSYDPGLTEADFTPDLPSDTTVHEPEVPDTQTYRRVSDLRDDTTITVPEPTLPPSYELTYATKTEGRIEGVGLRYVNRTSRITVSKYNFTYESESGDEQVTIDGHEARLSRGPTTSLSWNCGTYRYTIRGEGVSAELLISIGQSIGCPESTD